MGELIWRTSVGVVETGDVRSLESSDRVALIASYGKSSRVSRSLAALCDALDALGYRVAVIRAGKGTEPLIWPASASRPVVVRRPNRGYDFGSWSAAMELFPGVVSCSYVLLANDSLVGPFGSLEPVVQDFEETFTPAWGLTSTEQFIPHLQSYFLGFRDGVLADPNVRRFWRSVRHEDDKTRIIQTYELGMSRMLYGEAIAYTAFLPSELLVAPGQNPTIEGWRQMLERGVPMVKRELVRKPTIVRDGKQIPDEIRRRYGVDLAEWL